MPSAKEIFISRIKSLAISIEIDAVINKSLTEVKHNETARILRNGLTVVGFNALEDFIKLRTSEVLSDIGKIGIPFNSLPEKLQFAVTCDAVSALSFQLRFREKSDKISYIQEQALKISSTANTAYDLFPQAFGYDSSNLYEDTIKEILSCFLIKNPWGEMTIIGSNIGLVAMPLQETYKSAMQRRHKAAHHANTDIPQSDIKQFINDALAISITFDSLLSKAFSLISKHNMSYLKGKSFLDHNLVKKRIIKFSDNTWKEFPPGKTKDYRINSDKDYLVNEARARSHFKEELLIVFDTNNSIDTWDCF